MTSTPSPKVSKITADTTFWTLSHRFHFDSRLWPSPPVKRKQQFCLLCQRPFLFDHPQHLSPLKVRVQWTNQERQSAPVTSLHETWLHYQLVRNSNAFQLELLMLQKEPWSKQKSLLSKTLVNNIPVFNLGGPRIPETFDHLNLAVSINISGSRLIFIPWRASCGQPTSPGRMSAFKKHSEPCQD